MVAGTLEGGLLRRLSSLPTGGHPLLSLYLDLDPSRFPTPGAREAELSALLSGAGVRAGEAERIHALLRARPELLRDARALAIFSCADAGVLETVALSQPVEPLAVIDTVPWLEPLLALVTSENWGVAVVSRRAARLFRGGPTALVEFAAVEDEVHGRHAQGGWSQARFQRGIGQQVDEHLRHVGELVLGAHRRRPFDRLVVVAPDELWPAAEAVLDRELQDRIAGQVALDLEHASPEEVARAVAPVVERAEGEHERELMARLEEGLGTGGPAVAGLDEVLAMLEQERVEILLLVEGADLPAHAVERAIETAARGSAGVVVLRHEAAGLREHGSIAALLRW